MFACDGGERLARFVEDQTGQKARRLRRGLLLFPNGVFLQSLLNCLPSLAIDDAFVHARMALALMRDLADIDRVREDLVDCAAAETDASVHPPVGASMLLG